MLALFALACLPDVDVEALSPSGVPAAPEARAAPPPPPPPGLALLAEGREADIVSKLGLDHLGQLPTYSLDISLSDAEGAYEGRGAMSWTNTTGAPQATLPFLLHPNAPAELGAVGTASGSLRLTRAEVTRGPAGSLVNTRPTLAELRLERPLAPGESIEVALAFDGRLRQLGGDANDLFAQAFGGAGSLGAPVGGSDYGLLGQGDGVVTAASAFPMLAPFQSGVAVTAAPSGVGDLAWNGLMHFDLRVVTPEGLDVVTNLVDAPPRSLGGGAQVTACAGAAVRDLVLVASRSWVTTTRSVGGVTVRSWALAQDAAPGAEALEHAARDLAFFDRAFAPYPYTELDVVEASLVGGAGGVEFSALVLIAGFLYRDLSQSASPMAGLFSTFGALGGGGGLPPEMSELTAGQRRFVIAHELAHQWAPGLVGADAHRSPVVDEPLAQYMAGRALQDELGIEAGAEQREKNVLANFALYRLMGGSDGAADRPTGTYGSTLEYGALVYGKAPYLYVDLEEKVGQAALDRALRASFDELAWTETDGDAWLASLERHGARGAAAAGERWWARAHGDEDLGIDPEGRVAMALILGEDMAAQLEQSLGMLGMRPADLFRMLGGGLPTSRPFTPGAPGVQDMLDLLEGR